jgi:hypothetical protein
MPSSITSMGAPARSTGSPKSRIGRTAIRRRPRAGPRRRSRRVPRGLARLGLQVAEGDRTARGDVRVVGHADDVTARVRKCAEFVGAHEGRPGVPC